MRWDGKSGGWDDVWRNGAAGNPPTTKTCCVEVSASCASRDSMPQRPPWAIAHIGWWPAACLCPSQVQRTGGHAQGSTAARAVNQRSEGAKSEVASRMAKTVRIRCNDVPALELPRSYFTLAAGAKQRLRPSVAAVSDRRLNCGRGALRAPAGAPRARLHGAQRAPPQKLVQARGELLYAVEWDKKRRKIPSAAGLKMPAPRASSATTRWKAGPGKALLEDILPLLFGGLGSTLEPCFTFRAPVATVIHRQ